MSAELSKNEIETILESLKYSKQRIQDSQDTPYEVRKENLQRIDDVIDKLQNAKKIS
ncbi:MAG: hypothetical protein QM500_02380 [Methylococcales bacterium]